MDPIAVRVIRGDTVESVHRASLAVVDGTGKRVATFGNPRLVTFLRSTAKPLQAIPLIEMGTAKEFGLESRDLALIVGSHNGEAMHVQGVLRILERIGLAPTNLQCGAHAPYGKEAAKEVGEGYTSLHHNCSGKHAGMLAACVHQGWDLATYRDPSHPLQRRIHEIVAQEAGMPKEQIHLGVDGCGVPTFALPLSKAARAFARLSAPENIRGKRGESLRILRDALLNHPELVAGEDRTDTQFMRMAGGNVWVKAGAEACYAFGVKDRGWGGVIKVEDGSNRPLPLLLFHVLDTLGVLENHGRVQLEKIVTEPLRNGLGEAVGRMECDVQLRSLAKVR